MMLVKKTPWSIRIDNVLNRKYTRMDLISSEYYIELALQYFDKGTKTLCFTQNNVYQAPYTSCPIWTYLLTFCESILEEMKAFGT